MEKPNISSIILGKILVISSIFGFFAIIPSSQLAAAGPYTNYNHGPIRPVYDCSPEQYQTGECVDGGDNNGGTGGGSSSNSESITTKICNFAQTNPAAAETLARLLGYPGLEAAVSALCTTFR